MKICAGDCEKAADRDVKRRKFCCCKILLKLYNLKKCIASNAQKIFSNNYKYLSIGGMMFCPVLKKGEIISNRQLMNIFHCACEGGIRYATKTDTIVLVINNTKMGRPNKREGNKIFFAGQPMKGGMSGANKRLEQFLRENKNIYLFEVNEPGRYQYCGEIKKGGEEIIKHTGDGTAYPVFLLQLPDEQDS